MTTLKKGALPHDGRPLPTLEDYALDLHAIQTALPTTSGVVDRAHHNVPWHMYANGPDPTAPPQIADTGIGDCTCAGMVEAIKAMSSYAAGNTGVEFATADVIHMYSAVTGYVLGDESTDTGAQLADVCSYMVKTGIKDTTGKVHKLAGFAAIRSFGNLQMLKDALYTFGSVYLGVDYDDAAMNAFPGPLQLPQGTPNVGPDQIDHCVAMEYSAYGVKGIGNDETIVTYGTLQAMNQGWAEAMIGQAMVLISEDWISANGTSPAGQSLTQLIADSKLV